MNEAKWQCPHCSRYHVDEVVPDLPEPNDVLKCQFCGLHTIVEEITYFLHGSKSHD
jgi:transcription elongation factor Elf1